MGPLSGTKVMGFRLRILIPAASFPLWITFLTGVVTSICILISGKPGVPKVSVVEMTVNPRKPYYFIDKRNELISWVDPANTFGESPNEKEVGERKHKTWELLSTLYYSINLAWLKDIKYFLHVGEKCVG